MCDKIYNFFFEKETSMCSSVHLFLFQNIKYVAEYSIFMSYDQVFIQMSFFLWPVFKIYPLFLLLFYIFLINCYTKIGNSFTEFLLLWVQFCVLKLSFYYSVPNVNLLSILFYSFHVIKKSTLVIFKLCYLSGCLSLMFIFSLWNFHSDIFVIFHSIFTNYMCNQVVYL